MIRDNLIAIGALLVLAGMYWAQARMEPVFHRYDLGPYGHPKLRGYYYRQKVIYGD